MNNRAYATLEIKSYDDEKRIVRGVATSPTVDRMGDIIDPLGVTFVNPLSFLWQHKHDQPIGECKFEKPTKNGVNFEAQLLHPDKVESQGLKDRLQEAWDSIKTGLVKAVSIGFRPIEYSFMESGGIHFIETEVYELSAVTIPANADALISQIKSGGGEDAVMRAIKALDAEFRRDENIPDPEIPTAPEDPAAVGNKKVRQVKLDEPARGRAEPAFVIRSIKRTRK